MVNITISIPKIEIISLRGKVARGLLNSPVVCISKSLLFVIIWDYKLNKQFKIINI